MAKLYGIVVLVMLVPFVICDPPRKFRVVRANCTPPVIEQYPRPLMNQHTRVAGGLVLHAVVAVYTFIAIVIVCRQHFLTSIDRMCEELNVPPNVIAATFMAVGSSTPELVTMTWMVLIAQYDTSVSMVVGSSAMNTLLVLAVCTLYSSTSNSLTWWPVLRDCIFYALAVVVMLFVVYNDTITWIDALFMLLTYTAYCVVSHLNPKLEQKVNMWQQRFKWETPEIAMIHGRLHSIDADPEDTSLFDRLYRRLVYPINTISNLTIPNCTKQKHTKTYFATFAMSICWVAFYSFILVWMITIIGSTLKIPDSILYTYFMTAGLAVPDAILAYDTIKVGYGNMAIANLLGSNIFSILVCLGLPCFIQSAIVYPGRRVTILNEGITIDSLSLLINIGFLYIVLCSNTGILNKKLGAMPVFWFMFYTLFSTLYKLNVFGPTFTNVCGSLY